MGKKLLYIQEHVWPQVLRFKWFALGAVAFMIGLFLFQSGANDVARLERSVAALQTEFESVQADLTRRQAQTPDSEAIKDDVQTTAINARAFAKEVIAQDDWLVRAMYEPNFRDKPEAGDDYFAKFDATREYMQDLIPSFNRQSIRLNPEWSLELESVVDYVGSDRMPVMFKMTTGEGKLAGIMYGTYDDESKTLSTSTIRYTETGLRDEASVGSID